MRPTPLFHALAGGAAALLLVVTLGAKTQDEGGGEMADMMAKMVELTKTGEKHAFLGKLIGTWDTEMRFTMPGMEGMPPEKGTSEVSWLIEGRWLQTQGTGSMMGRPMQNFSVMGYDTFKQSFRVMMVNSIDNAMLVSEGDLTQDEKVLITYGTLDEYLTGEHDKMVKYVWRFLSEDEHVLEVHDLPIGETNTKVFEIRAKRRK